MSMLRAMVLTAGVLLLSDNVGAATPPEPGKKVAKVAVNIEAQPLTAALNKWAEQTGMMVMVPAEGEALIAPRVVGNFTAEEALVRLLGESGYRYEFVNAGTVAVHSGKEGTQGMEKTSGLSRELAGMRVAQADAWSSMEASAAERREGEQGKQEAWGSAAEVQDAKLEEIVVTAQKRTELLQDVPISISVLSGQQLDSSSYSGAVDAIRTLPGVDTYESQYSGGVTFSVRGVSNVAPNFGGAGPIAYYIDGVPYGFIRSSVYPDPSIYDLERIEFLNGPQGTLYGASALNGVMRILTHNANADAFELKTRGAFYSTEGGTGSYRGDLAVNVPLIEGRLGVRAVVGYQDDGGWIDARPVPGTMIVDPNGAPGACSPDSPQGCIAAPNRDDVNDQRRRNYRLKVHAQPSETLSVDLTAWRLDTDTGAPPYSQDDGTIRAALPQSQFSNYKVYGATALKEFSAFSLTSMTSYIDFESYGIVDGNPPGVNFPGTQETQLDARVFAQEFNLASRIEGPLHWVTGAFYRDAKDLSYDLYNSDFLFSYREVLDDFTDTSESYAVFGEIGRRFFNDKLDVAVGLRYFHDKQVMTLNSSYPSAGTLVPGDSFEAISEAWTPRAVLTWTPTPDQMVYLSYGQGFRSGFAQSPAVQKQVPDFTPAKPDKLTNYEVGTKASILGGRLSYEAAVFYIDWQDPQQIVSTLYDTTGNVQVLVTAVLSEGSISGPGASFGLTVRPLGGLELGANASCNDLKNHQTVQINQAGKRPPSSPECTYGASAQYEWALGSGFQARLGISGTYKGRAQGDALILDETTGINYNVSDEITMARAQLAIESSRNWRAMLYADNLTDEDSTPGRAYDTPLGSADWSQRYRPRTLGVQLEYNFGGQ